MRLEGLLRACTVTVALALCHATGQAQMLLDREDVYRIEVIVFERAAPLDPYYRFPGLPRTDHAVQVELDENISAGPIMSRNRVPFWPAEFRDLRPVRDRLERLGEYRPLLTMAWEQKAEVFGATAPVSVRGGRVLERSEAPAISLLDKATDPTQLTEVEGTATLERGRFIHVALDLAFRRPQNTEGPVLPMTTRLRFDVDHRYQVHRINESRQVELDRVQYFDHPKFGALVLVKAVEPDEPPRQASNY
ncbi:MAG: CsiV family protein [Xanthomonadales bacterium]|nr:CsiV family protein [Xanthomonadales bacterium]